MPTRIRLSRAKGWRLPEGAVSVARPGKWGNVFMVMPSHEDGVATARGRYVAVASVREAVERYRVWIASTPEGRQLACDARTQLRGKDLACWCKLGEPCHADILLEVANA